MTDRLFLIARIAGRPVAIASDAVDAVVNIDRVVPVPGVDRRVRGLAALRSRVVTVVDPRTALGSSPQDADGPRRAVVINHAGHPYAILVDALEDVASHVAEPVSDGMVLEPGWQDVVRGLIARDGETLPIVDPAGLVPDAAPQPSN